MATPPDTLEEWLDKAKVFHGHKLRIDDLWSWNCPYTFRSHQTSSSHMPHDPNTMEVDFIKLKKLTPCYASQQTYGEVNDTYSEGGTHEETLHPQSKARVMNKRRGD